jgi:hypothetical protein
MDSDEARVSESYSTPPFLLWSLEQTCSIRGFEDGTEPERVERQLRAVRSAADAMREGRVCDGIALAPPRGFHIERTLAMYGGLATIQATCANCPANVLPEPAHAASHHTRFAGCFGLVPLPYNIAERTSGNDWKVEELFPATNPPWYGLWMASPLTTEQAAAMVPRITKLADELSRDSCQAASELTLLASALQRTAESELRLHVRLSPPGRVDRGWWRLDPHCPRCQGPWTGKHPARSPGISHKARECPACGYIGQPAPDKKRRARGPRPYLMLDRLLGETEARALLAKFAAISRQPAAPPQSPDPGQSPPEPALPDNPPAG